MTKWAISTLLFLAMSMPIFAQTTVGQTMYSIPVGQLCSAGRYNSQIPLAQQGLTGPESCPYHPDGISSTNGYGRFETYEGGAQLVFTGELGYSCTGGSWIVSDVNFNDLGPTARKFTFDCSNAVSNTTSQYGTFHGMIHAEIVAYSYVQKASICYHGSCIYTVVWSVLDNSFVSLTVTSQTPYGQ